MARFLWFTVYINAYRRYDLYLYKVPKSSII